MAFNGSGLFNRIYSWANDKANGINITASRMDTEDSGFATGLSNTICKDGQQTTTARIPFAVGLSVNQGSVGTPSIAFIGDTSTGIYQTASGHIKMALSGTNKWNLTSEGMGVGAVPNASQGITQIYKTVAGGSPQSSGTTDSNQIFAAGSAAGGAQLRYGSYASGAGWAQISNSGNYATNYSLDLNPNGGGVAVNGAYQTTQGVFQVRHTGNAGGNPQNTGTTDAAQTQAITMGSVQFRMGVYGSGNIWIQASAAANYATNYDLYLNPNGGNVIASTQAAGDNSTKVATTAFVNGTALTLATGTTAATQTAGDNSTKVATTAYVDRGSSGASKVLLGKLTASGSASISLTGIPSTYDVLEIEIENAIPATNGSVLWMRTSTNNGVSYISTASYVWYEFVTTSGPSNASASNLSETAYPLGVGGIGNGSSIGLSGTIKLFKYASTSIAHHVTALLNWYDGASYKAAFQGGFVPTQTAAINALQFLTSSGNFTGTISIYGVRNA